MQISDGFARIYLLVTAISLAGFNLGVLTPVMWMGWLWAAFAFTAATIITLSVVRDD